MSASVGFGFAARSAQADMIWPDWQYPHCGTSPASQAFCTAAPTGVLPTPSIVVISFPTTELRGTMHERAAAPSTCTVHAPHKAAPHPNLVPVIPKMSRSAQSSGMSSGPSTWTRRPLIFIAGMPCLHRSFRRTVRARRCPFSNQLAELALSARRWIPSFAGIPRPRDERIRRKMHVDLGQSMAAVAHAVLYLLADLRE